MTVLLKGGMVPAGGGFAQRDIRLKDSVITDMLPDLPEVPGDRVFFLQGCHLLPGLADVHVHLREPGFSVKETVRTGTRAAARGGFTAVCAMPNVEPAPDCAGGLRAQLEIIERDALVPVYPIGCITEGRAGARLVDFGAVASGAPAGAVAGFSDDGSGVQDDELMLRALRQARRLGTTICAHCEDERYPAEDARSEWKQLERDLELVAREMGECPEEAAAGKRAVQAGRPLYHACHLSCRESVDLMRRAKARGLPVSCETAPHYLVFCREELPIGQAGREDEGGRFKMNPPIRGAEDRRALLEAVADGTIDAIATDHAPHTAEEKSRGFAASLNGVVGLETAFAVMHTALVRNGVLPLHRLLALMSASPRRLFGLGAAEIRPGAPLDAVAVALDELDSVDPAHFASLGHSTPFAGRPVWGKVKATWAGGRMVYQCLEGEERFGDEV